MKHVCTNREGGVSDAGEGAVVGQIANAEDVDAPSVHTVQHVRQLLLIGALYPVAWELLPGEAVGVRQGSLHTGYLQVNSTDLVRQTTKIQDLFLRKNYPDNRIPSLFDKLSLLFE